jgi:membrane protease subunit HflK
MRGGVPYRSISVTVILALPLIYLLSGIYFIAPEEEAVVKRFGRVVHEGITPGIHYRLPYPFEQEYKLKTKVVYKMSAGYRIVDGVRSNLPLEAEMRWLTGDTNVVNIRMLIQYTISRPAFYLFAMESPDIYIRNVVESLLTRIAGSTTIDELLTVGKGRLTTVVWEKAQKLLDESKTGIRISSISIIAIDPPQNVISAFKDVSDAKLDRERIINEAQSYENEAIPRARGQAGVLLQQAGATKEQRILGARGASERFLKLLEEYRHAPAVTRERMYLMAMEEILPGVNKYLIHAAPGEKTSLRIFGPNNNVDSH